MVVRATEADSDVRATVTLLVTVLVTVDELERAVALDIPVALDLAGEALVDLPTFVGPFIIAPLDHASTLRALRRKPSRANLPERALTTVGSVPDLVPLGRTPAGRMDEEALATPILKRDAVDPHLDLDRLESPAQSRLHGHALERAHLTVIWMDVEEGKHQVPLAGTVYDLKGHTAPPFCQKLPWMMRERTSLRLVSDPPPTHTSRNFLLEEI